MERQIDQLLEASSHSNVPVQVRVDSFGRYRVLSQDGFTSTGTRQMLIVGQSLDEVTRTTTNLAIIYDLTGLLGVVGAVIVTRLLVKARLRPLDQLQITATQVANLPLAAGEESLTARVPDNLLLPGTEVGQVGAAFNTMLDHVESSFEARQRSEDKLRRFVADASHELRTPLAAVSGYAELATRTAQGLPKKPGTALIASTQNPHA